MAAFDPQRALQWSTNSAASEIGPNTDGRAIDGSHS